MGSGGIGTALGGKLIARFGLASLFLCYGLGLLGTLLVSYLLVRDRVVESAGPETALESP